MDGTGAGAQRKQFGVFAVIQVIGRAVIMGMERGEALETATS